MAHPIQFLKGVGPARARLLERLGLLSVRDMLRFYPRTWEDRRECSGPPAPDVAGPLVLRGRVIRAAELRTRAPVSLFKASLSVPALGPGPVEALWFKRPSRRYDVFRSLKEQVRPGADLWVVGRAEPALLEPSELRVEEFYALGDPKASLHVGRLVPVYPSTEGLSQRFLRELSAQALDLCGQEAELLPTGLILKRGLLAAPQALRAIHFPRSSAELEEARRRLAYEELLLLELAWSLKRRQTRSVSKGYSYALKRTLLTPFRSRLGFELTAAQKRVINEIFADLRSPHPMTRLLQGDVGSGKTVVAVAALLLAVESGWQGALLAPTEILAEQHFWTLARLLEGLPVRLSLLSSRLSKPARAEALAALAEGRADIAVGTHALLEEDVRFARLRLAVIDEQHRFGVRQRTTLRRKGPPMDLLVMTATPIPRTLALALYGDLSVSTLDEMPPGRAPVSTFHGPEERALSRVREEAALGRQSFIVYPVISESSRAELKAARQEFERLERGALKGLRLALLHGQLPAKRKTAAMELFLKGELDALIATPVVEVGVDAPNATVMVVQNADRFGLASLHQLRGRVGRGTLPSECWLVAEPRTPEAQRRIAILRETSDGFCIGEEDLRLRGPGEVLGTSQHGEMSLLLADILKDGDLLALARKDAEALLAADPRLQAPAHGSLRERLVALYQRQWNVVDLA